MSHMTDHATDETGWRVVAANMVETQRRALWEPRNEPMTARDYVAAAAIAVMGVAAYWLWSAVLS